MQSIRAFANGQMSICEGTYARCVSERLGNVSEIKEGLVSASRDEYKLEEFVHSAEFANCIWVVVTLVQAQACERLRIVKISDIQLVKDLYTIFNLGDEPESETDRK